MPPQSRGRAAIPGRAASPQKPYAMGAFDRLGFNLRLSDIQAAVGVAQMAKLDRLLDERRRHRRALYRPCSAKSPGIAVPHVPEGCGHTYQSYVIRVVEGGGPRRNAIMDWLAEPGIQTRPGTHAVHRLGYYARKYGLRPEEFPNACAGGRHFDHRFRSSPACRRRTRTTWSRHSRRREPVQTLGLGTIPPVGWHAPEGGVPSAARLAWSLHWPETPSGVRGLDREVPKTAEVRRLHAAVRDDPDSGPRGDGRGLAVAASLPPGFALANDCEYFSWRDFCTLGRWLTTGRADAAGSGAAAPRLQQLLVLLRGPGEPRLQLLRRRTTAARRAAWPLIWPSFSSSATSTRSTPTAGSTSAAGFRREHAQAALGRAGSPRRAALGLDESRQCAERAESRRPLGERVRPRRSARQATRTTPTSWPPPGFAISGSMPTPRTGSAWGTGMGRIMKTGWRPPIRRPGAIGSSVGIRSGTAARLSRSAGSAGGGDGPRTPAAWPTRSRRQTSIIWRRPAAG